MRTRLQEQAYDAGLVDGPSRRLGRRVPSEKNAPGGGELAGDAAQELRAAHARHQLVGDDDIEGLVTEHLQRELRRGRRRNLVRVLEESAPQSLDDLPLIIDEEHLGHRAPVG